jgi:hypothetical protein
MISHEQKKISSQRIFNGWRWLAVGRWWFAVSGEQLIPCWGNSH